MTIRLGAAMVLSLASSMLCAQEAAAHALQRDDQALKDELVAKVDVFMHAWQRQDAASLTATMASEFAYVTSRGVAPRAGIVAALTHVCTLTNYSLSDVQLLQLSSDSAVLIYKIHQVASCAGHADPPVVLNTDTLVRREGRWLFVLTTSTPAA